MFDEEELPVGLDHTAYLGKGRNHLAYRAEALGRYNRIDAGIV
jgi:hypothetical protein